jgi:hypothetical protein
MFFADSLDRLDQVVLTADVMVKNRWFTKVIQASLDD